MRESVAVAQPEIRKRSNVEAVTVQMRSAPGNAQLSLDGVPLPGNPSTRVLPKDSKIHVLRADADGYHAATAEFTTANESSVELKLEKLEPAVLPAPLAARPQARMKGGIVRVLPVRAV